MFKKTYPNDGTHVWHSKRWYACASVIKFETRISLTANQQVLCRSGTCSSHFRVLTDLRHTSIRLIFIQASFTISFSYTIAALPRASPLPAPVASRRLRLHPPPTSNKNMESTNSDDDASDSDDMSAGARLMRYNVFDEPRPDCRSFELESCRRSSSIGPISQTAYDPLVQNHPRDGPQEGFSDLDRFPEHVIVFRRGPTELEGHILNNTAGCQRHSKIMLKISALHPRAHLVSKVLTWHTTSTLKDRTRPGCVSERHLMRKAHETWTANRMAPKSKQLPYSRPQRPAPKPVKTRTSTSSRLPQLKERRCSHIDHVHYIHFVATLQRHCVLAGL